MKMWPSGVRYFFSQWRRWIGPLFAIVYIILVITIVPTLVVRAFKNGVQKSAPWLVAGGFVLLAIPISLWEIAQHIMHYNKPSLQKHIIRILWMVPIYAINAWLGLLFPLHSIYVDSMRECYEAYVIYNFMVYLLNYLQEGDDLQVVLERKPQIYHMFPLCCLAPWPMGVEFIHNCKHGILQYTVVRPLSTIISVICELCGVYGESDFSPNVAFPYMVAVNNLSQFVAMYCLVLFYRANKTELKPMNPLGKFLCIKAVVFFSFFQGVLINILAYCGVLSSVFNTEDADDIKIISSSMQDFLICIEMFLAAIAHHYSFSYKPFVSPLDSSSSSCLDSFRAMWDMSDVKSDISEHLGVVGGSFSRRFRGKHNYTRAKGFDESSRLVTEPTTSSSAPATFTVPEEEVKTTTSYGTIENTISEDTEPLLTPRSDDPNC